MQSHHNDDDQKAFDERMRSLRRADPDALLPSDIPLNVPTTPEEELARLVRNNDVLMEIFRVCQEAGYYGKTSLVEFIKEHIK